MSQHRPENEERPAPSTLVHPGDASLLRGLAFSRYRDLVVCLTGRNMRALAESRRGSDAVHEWAGDVGAAVPTLISVVRELADRFKLPAGMIFTGRTITLHNQAGAIGFDVAPYDDLTSLGVNEDDIFLSFRNGLIPRPEYLDQFQGALETILNAHYPDHQLDIIERPEGVMFAVRRSNAVAGLVQGRRLQSPSPRPDTKPQPRPVPVDDHSNQMFDAMISDNDDDLFAVNIIGIPKKAQAERGIKEYVTRLLAASDDSIFCLDKQRYGIRSRGFDHWAAFGMEAGNPTSSVSFDCATKHNAILRAAELASDYAEANGYGNTAAGISQFLLEEIEETGRLHTHGYDIFITGPLSVVGSSVPAFVLERTPVSNNRTPRDSTIQMSVGDADIFHRIKFTRERDAKIYLAAIFDFNEWLSTRPRMAVASDLEVRAAANALREIAMPPGTRFISKAGWDAIPSDAAKMQFCEDRMDRFDLLRNLSNSGPGMALILLGGHQVDAETIANEIERRTGYSTTAMTSFGVLVMSTRPNSAHNQNTGPQPPPSSSQPPAPTPPEPKPARYVSDRERFKDVELPPDDDEFGLTFASTRMAGRKPITVAFDYDGTLVFPDEANGGIEYDEFGEAISVLNPAAAELMRLHASRGDKVVIVTCRTPESKDSMWEMVSDNGLPVSEIYCTSHSSKAPTLDSIGAAIHYDDSNFRSDEIRQALGPTVKVYHPDDMEKNIRMWGGK